LRWNPLTFKFPLGKKIIRVFDNSKDTRNQFPYEYNHNYKTRKSIGRQGETEFVVGGSSSKNESLVLKRFYQACWVVLAVLTIRMVMMDRGVWDYYKKYEKLEMKKFQIHMVEKENNNLKKEIARLKVDKKYQKQMAREHLGVIADDEYLILFAQEL
jgi:cell division protein FtsB